MVTFTNQTSANNPFESFVLAEEPQCMTYAVFLHKHERFNAADSNLIKAILVPAFCVLFLGGIVANITICISILRSKYARKSRAIFMLNLLMADLLLCVTSVPVSPAATLMHYWVFGSVMCRLMSASQGIAVVVSIWSLTMVIVNKYLYIVSITRSGIGCHSALVIAVVIWLVALLESSPYILYTNVYSGDIFTNEELPGGFCGEYCIEYWPLLNESGFPLKQVLTCTFLVLNLLVPSVVITFCYWRILSKIDRDMVGGSTNTNMANAVSQTYSNRARAGKRRILNMSVAVVIGFVTAWLPILVRNVLLDFDYDNDYFIRYEQSISLISHFTAMTTVLTNPAFLWALNRQITRKSSNTQKYQQYRAEK